MNSVQIRWTPNGLLRVTPRAQPGDAAVAVQPLVYFGFAFETGDLNRFDARTFRRIFHSSSAIRTSFKTSFALAMGLYGDDSDSNLAAVDIS
jgi:hypothetical protein